MLERHSMENVRGLERQQKLASIGVERLSLPEMQGVATSFGQHLRAGLERKPSSIPTIPTHLKPVDTRSLAPGRSVLVVEMGGTNVYAATVIVQDNHDVAIVGHVQQPYLTKTYESANSFFERVSTIVQPLLGESPQAVGIIWSFPGDVRQIGRNVDVDSYEALPKEFIIPGISAKPIGEQLIASLPNVNKDIPRAVANDTAAVLLANGGSLGGIIGTGFNLAFSHNGDMYNLESGRFTGLLQTDLTQQIDAESKLPGQGMAEKQISG